MLGRRNTVNLAAAGTNECVMIFYGLNAKAEVWKLNNMDTVLHWDPETKLIWTLG
jgi:hypothetical protein